MIGLEKDEAVSEDELLEAVMKLVKRLPLFELCNDATRHHAGWVSIKMFQLFFLNFVVLQGFSLLRTFKWLGLNDEKAMTTIQNMKDLVCP